jgi:NAD(P)-dependent dehydrogenase (short-subunit alcohol dehydrogenase family)
MPKGKTAVITGSTGGIGLGIATALAAGGSNVLLNGFGDVAEIEKLRKELASDYGVRVAYVAAKHGVLGLTEVVALETATTGVTCNAICPGWVLTPLVQKQIDDLAAREKLTPQAGGRSCSAKSSRRSNSRQSRLQALPSSFAPTLRRRCAA